MNIQENKISYKTPTLCGILPIKRGMELSVCKQTFGAFVSSCTLMNFINKYISARSSFKSKYLTWDF